jgi:hypothetical protein
MNEVSAAVGRLALAMLSEDHLSGISERWPEIAQCFHHRDVDHRPTTTT